VSLLPVVSIVGRPNVGKSSLFNRILRQRIAVVGDTPGVTRDRNYKETSWNRFRFNLVDTGGFVPTSKESIPFEINKQVDIAIQESEVIIFLVEALPGPTDLDLLIAKKLRRICLEKIIVAVNKTESQTAYNDAVRHISLGCGDPLPISAIHGNGVGDLLDKVSSLLERSPKIRNEEIEDIALSIAVVGRPNSGKSSFVNKLLKNDRMIVNSAPFTTRDSIDSIFMYERLKIRIVDTAGLRKKAQVHDDIEYFSNLRALDSVKRCDICIILIDSILGIGEQDLKILNHVSRFNKGMIICLNKWDIVKKDFKTFDTVVAEYKKMYREVQHIPVISISALTGQRVRTVIDTALKVKQRMTVKIKPLILREAFFSWIKVNPHPYISNKNLRFLGIKQLKTDYPHFVCYCANPRSLLASYNRFLINKFQKDFDFSGCPIVLSYKPMGKSKKNQYSVP
jgi:GTP-binding protein